MIKTTSIALCHDYQSISVYFATNVYCNILAYWSFYVNHHFCILSCSDNNQVNIFSLIFWCHQLLQYLWGQRNLFLCNYCIMALSKDGSVTCNLGQVLKFPWYILLHWFTGVFSVMCYFCGFYWSFYVKIRMH